MKVDDGSLDVAWSGRDSWSHSCFRVSLAVCLRSVGGVVRCSLAVCLFVVVVVDVDTAVFKFPFHPLALQQSLRRCQLLVCFAERRFAGARCHRVVQTNAGIGLFFGSESSAGKPKTSVTMMMGASIHLSFGKYI